jgi:hypothetical protein
MPHRDIEASYHSINQFFVVSDADGFIAFLKAVLDGVEARTRDLRPDGSIGHANVAIGDSHVMISDSEPQSTRPAQVSPTPMWPTSTLSSLERWPPVRRTRSRPRIALGAIASRGSQTHLRTAGGSPRQEPALTQSGSEELRPASAY